MDTKDLSKVQKDRNIKLEKLRSEGFDYPNDFEKKSALKKHLKDKVGLNDNKAEREAESMINGYKKIENGKYAVLDKGDYEYRYYKRVKNKWILEEKFNEYIDQFVCFLIN